MSEDDHLANRFIDVQPVLARWRFFDEITDPADDAAGTIAVRDDVSERQPHLLQIRRRQPSSSLSATPVYSVHWGLK